LKGNASDQLDQESDDDEDMIKETALLKKLKKKKITEQEFEEAVGETEIEENFQNKQSFKKRQNPGINFSQPNKKKFKK